MEFQVQRSKVETVQRADRKWQDIVSDGTVGTYGPATKPAATRMCALLNKQHGPESSTHGQKYDYRVVKLIK